MPARRARCGRQLRVAGTQLRVAGRAGRASPIRITADPAALAQRGALTRLVFPPVFSWVVVVEECGEISGTLAWLF